MLREAIRLLEHHTVAHTQRGANGGLIVTEPRVEPVTRAVSTYLRFNQVEAADVVECRGALELAGVQLAAQRIEAAGIELLRNAVAEDERPLHAWRDRDCPDFHVLVAELSGNPALSLFVTTLIELSGHLACVRQHDARQGLRRTRESHRCIAEAIVAGDGPLARRHMAQHLHDLGELWAPGTVSVI